MWKAFSTFPWSDLLEWYDHHGRHDLPWRDYLFDENFSTSPSSIVYRVWLSEIFLQQTQVSRVIGYFDRVLERFPTIESLASTDYETFFPYYQGLGYYSRARNMLQTAQIVRDTYGWRFPNDIDTLSKLPGVWPYTARAILAFWYGEPYLAWDTNLEKVFARYYNGDKNKSLTRKEKGEIEADFRSFCIYYCHQASKQEFSSFWAPRRIQDSPSLDPSFHSGWQDVENQARHIIVRTINNALMDFASVMDLKNPSSIDWEKYPIKSGKFYETRWSLEGVEVKKFESFPIPDASVVVILHKDHKVYYSDPSMSVIARNEAIQILRNSWIMRSTQDNSIEYSPFLLPPALHRDTREYVKSYFREKYNLELSVRPLHKKWLSEDGKPYIAVNAQIQTWTHSFEEYRKIS
jgi:A/G-specific adenine glycosylase